MDYVVRLTGKDNLSQTINNVKKELNDVGKATSQIDKIDAKFERITKSSAPLKRQLRDLQALMAQMNFDGLSNTEQFTKIAQEAGRIKDAIADAADATKRFSSDTLKLDAAIQGIQGIAAASSIATGAMALFGNENKEVQQAILKVQAALSILNGVQAIANTLNKDSALMQRIKQIQLAATTTATAGNTVSTVANTTATVANTAAQKAWNTTKAVGKALLGDWTGLLVLGVAGLTAYSLATSKSADSNEELSKSTKEAAEAQNTFGRTLADTYAGLMTKYTQLQTEWKKLSSTHQKAEWIKDNKTKLDELEISVNNVADAEKAFNGNTDAVVQSFVKRAKAAARLAQLTELYRKQIELIDKRNEVATQIQTDAAKHGRSAKAGDEITDATFRNSRYGSVNSAGKWTFSEAGAKLYSGTDTNNNQEIKKIDSDINGINKQIGLVVNAIKDESKAPVIKTEIPSTNRTTNKVTTKTEVKAEAKEGSINAMNAELNKLQDALRNGLIPDADIEKTKVRIEQLKKDIEAKEIELGFKIPVDKVAEESKKLQERYNSLNRTNNVSSFDLAVGNQKTGLDAIQSQMDLNDTLLEQLNEILFKYQELGLQGSEAFNRVADEIVNVQEQQSKLGSTAAKLTEERTALENNSEAWGYYSQMLDSTSNALNILGDSQAAQIAQFGLNTAALIADCIKTIAAMQAQALAAGTASGAKLPFPANIAAIATIVGTVASIFASLPKFADGGIVGGGSMYGDKVLLRANSGEMLINRRQQSNLFNMLDEGRINSGNLLPTLKIKGSDFYIMWKNYANIYNKSGKNITI